jgi:hypothetical protein
VPVFISGTDIVAPAMGFPSALSVTVPDRDPMSGSIPVRVLWSEFIPAMRAWYWKKQRNKRKNDVSLRFIIFF